MDLARIVDREPQPDVVELEALREVMNFQITKLNDSMATYSLQHYFFLVSVACYHYGIMQGKRIERARRSGKTAVKKVVKLCKAMKPPAGVYAGKEQEA